MNLADVPRPLVAECEHRRTQVARVFHLAAVNFFEMPQSVRVPFERLVAPRAPVSVDRRVRMYQVIVPVQSAGEHLAAFCALVLRAVDFMRQEMRF